MMFEGFETRTIPGDGAEIFCRIGGSGAPLLLLHGFPQTGAMWAPVAAALAGRFTLVVPDLRGYGRSGRPASQGGVAYSKRQMGADMRAVMTTLGFGRFHVSGHDRGARVAYRLALDTPEVVEKLAVLDIMPTAEMWGRMDSAAAMKSYHWSFLAQPEPLPERLIGGDPAFFLEHTMARWTKAKSLDAFAPEALAEYRDAFATPEGVHAACEDYRAGATTDRRLDEEDRTAGRRITVPTLALWGVAGTPAANTSVLDVWREWCDEVEGHALDCGHFVAEEAPRECADALLAFFSR